MALPCLEFLRKEITNQSIEELNIDMLDDHDPGKPRSTNMTACSGSGMIIPNTCCAQMRLLLEINVADFLLSGEF